MATNALRILDKTTLLDRQVSSGSTGTQGMPAVQDADDNLFKDGAAATAATVVGVFVGPTVASGDTKRGQEIALFDAGVIPVKVGTGGATRGLYAKIVDTGFTDAPVGGAGSTTTHIFGKFMQNGSAGEFVGLQPCLGVLESA